MTSADRRAADTGHAQRALRMAVIMPVSPPMERGGSFAKSVFGEMVLFLHIHNSD